MLENIKELILIIIPILTGLMGIGLQKWWLSYKTKKFKLEDHPLFADLCCSINDIQSWSPAKNRYVFIDALIIKLSYWKNSGEQLAKDLQNANLSNMQLQNKIIKWATQVITDYTKEWRNTNIPNKVIERITKTHEEKVIQFINEIKSITFNNDMYPFKMQKVIAIFNTLRLLLSDTKNDFNKLVYRDTYNGEFTNCKYKDIPVSDTEYHIYLTKQ